MSFSILYDSGCIGSIDDARQPRRIQACLPRDRTPKSGSASPSTAAAAGSPSATRRPARPAAADRDRRAAAPALGIAELFRRDRLVELRGEDLVARLVLSGERLDPAAKAASPSASISQPRPARAAPRSRPRPPAVRRPRPRPPSISASSAEAPCGSGTFAGVRKLHVVRLRLSRLVLGLVVRNLSGSSAQLVAKPEVGQNPPRQFRERLLDPRYCRTASRDRRPPSSSICAPGPRRRLCRRWEWAAPVNCSRIDKPNGFSQRRLHCDRAPAHNPSASTAPQAPPRRSWRRRASHSRRSTRRACSAASKIERAEDLGGA